MADEYKSIGKLIDDIKQDVGRIGNKIARGVAEVAAIELQDAHREIMNDYYSGYTPVKSYAYQHITSDGKFYGGMSHGYHRTYNLKYKSIIPKGVIPSGKHSFKATVEIGSANMENYTNVTGHEFPASAVFDLMWNQANRGLPPGYRGHIGTFSISASPAGVAISGSPDQAMKDFVESWGTERGGDVADIMASNI